VAYLRFEENPDEDLDFRVAQIVGRTVDELRQTISNEEFVAWGVWLARERQREELRWRS
jgi:hypothetical protein